MSSNGTSTVHDEIDPEHSTDGTQSNCQDGRHEDEQGSPSIIQTVSEAMKAFVSGNATSTPSDEDGEEKTLLQSMGEKLMQSAHSVREAVSGSNDSDTAEDGEEKTLLQSMGEKLMQSAHSVREAVSGSNDSDTAENEEEEKSLVQSVSERIAQSAQSVKEAVTGSTGEDDEGEEKTGLQAVGEKIVQSVITVKDAVKGDVHIIPGDDETAELSILVHTILD